MQGGQIHKSDPTITLHIPHLRKKNPCKLLPLQLGSYTLSIVPKQNSIK